MKSSSRPVVPDRSTPQRHHLGHGIAEVESPRTRVLPSVHESSAGWPRVRGYDIQSVVGSGGMGVVYRARHRELNRIVALKTLRGSALADIEFRDRFRTEAEAVARLQHPNIIQVFEVGFVESTPGEVPSPFIALEFVEGGSLASLTSKPQPPWLAAEMLLKVARAVHAAHVTGIIHRDLKPANVLLTRDGQPKVADFGLAKQVGCECTSDGRFVTQAGTTVGTPEYMAPEQVTGAAPTPALDVFAMGVILYELLTARVPFQAASPVETMNLVLDQEPVSPRRLQPDLPRDLETICLKCLEKDPARRYSSAEALAEDLEHFLTDRPIHARRVSDWERVRRWCQRNPLTTATLTVAAVVLVAAFAAVTRSYLQADHARKSATERERAERWERYRAVIGASASSMRVFDVGSARRHLEAAPVEHRDWEWRHLHGRLDLAERVIVLANDSLASQHYFRGQRWLASVKPNGSVRLVHLQDPTASKTISAPAGWTAPLLSPDETTLLFRVGDQAFGLIDVDTGTTIGVIGGPDMPLATNYFAERSSWLLTGAGNTVHEWDLRTGSLIRAVIIPRIDAHALTLASNGRFLGWRDIKNRTARIIDLDTGREIASFGGHGVELLSLQFSPDSNRVVTVDGFPNNTIRLWDVKSGNLIRELGRHNDIVTSVAFSNDGRRIAASSRDQVIRLWDGNTGDFIVQMRGHLGPVTRVNFSPDDRHVLSASEDHTVRLWNAANGDPLAVLHGHLREVHNALFTADGTRIISASGDGTVRFWDPQTIERDGFLHGHDSFIYGAAFHPDGVRAATAGWDGAVRIWDTATGSEIRKLIHPDKAIVTSVAFHPDGKRLATRSRNEVRLWHIESGRELKCWPAPINAWHDTNLAFNPRGNLLATGCDHAVLRIWDIESDTDSTLASGHVNEIRDVVFSPDGLLMATAGDDGDMTVRIWDMRTRTVIQTLEGHTQAIFNVIFDRSGTKMATASNDGTARIWDTASGKQLAVLSHATRVYSVAFNREGTRLACGCADNSIRIWDTRTHQEIVDLRGHRRYVFRLAFNADGSRLLSASGDATARVWHAPAPVTPR